MGNFNLEEIITLVDADKLEGLLKKSSNKKDETEFLVNGFRKGFNINYTGPKCRRDEANNIPFRVGNKEILWEKLMTEVRENRVAGPYDSPPYDYYIQSPLGLVPKANGKVRMIFHLSYEFKDKSVNQCIPDHLCTVKYNDLDQAVKLTLGLLRRPVVYGKTDFSNAYRLVPLSPESRPWLLMKVINPRTHKIQYIVEKCPPFGASISCAIFQRFLNVVRYIFLFTINKKGLTISR